jgi:hypothetical protein
MTISCLLGGCLLAAILSGAGCSKSDVQKAQDNTGSAAKDAGTAVKEGAKEAGKTVEKAADKTADAVKDATKKATDAAK